MYYQHQMKERGPNKIRITETPADGSWTCDFNVVEKRLGQPKPRPLLLLFSLTQDNKIIDKDKDDDNNRDLVSHSN